MFELVGCIFQLLITTFCLCVHIFVQEKKDLKSAICWIYTIELLKELSANL